MHRAGASQADRLELQCWCLKSATSLQHDHCLKGPYFLFICKAVKMHTCTNTYMEGGWSEISVLRFLQMCVRLTHCLTHMQPGMVYGSTAHQMLLGKGSQPLWASSAHAKGYITWLQKGCMKKESIETVLCLLYALAPWNTPQCCCLLRSGLTVMFSRSGIAHTEFRLQCRSRDLLLSSRKQELKVGDSPFNLFAPNPFVKINIAIWQRTAVH